MKTAKKALKTTGKTLYIILELLCLYIIAGLFIPYITVNRNVEKNGSVAIYILSNGVHTDLVVPIKNDQMDWNQLVKADDTVGKDSAANFVAFGWGDKGFYLDTPTWAELKFSTAFKAAFALGESAIHTTFYKEMIEGENCIKINISRQNYKRLIYFIENSFDKDVNGNLINIKTNAVYGTNDTFYESKGTYNLFYTCNTWANNGLKACNQKAGMWALLDEGIFYHYR